MVKPLFSIIIPHYDIPGLADVLSVIRYLFLRIFGNALIFSSFYSVLLWIRLL